MWRWTWIIQLLIILRVGFHRWGRCFSTSVFSATRLNQIIVRCRYLYVWLRNRTRVRRILRAIRQLWKSTRNLEYLSSLWWQNQLPFHNTPRHRWLFTVGVLHLLGSSYILISVAIILNYQLWEKFIGNHSNLVLLWCNFTLNRTSKLEPRVLYPPTTHRQSVK